MRGNSIKTIDQLAELQYAHLFGQLCRTAYICKEHAQGDFRAARVIEFFTRDTEAGIVLGLVSTNETHEKTTPDL